MTYTVTQLKSDIIAGLHGTTINQISNFNGLIQRAASQFLLAGDFKELKRITASPVAYYNSVYDYPLPTDVKGNRIIDIAPQKFRWNEDHTEMNYDRTFDRTLSQKANNAITVRYNTGVRTLRTQWQFAQQPVLIDSMNAINNWVVSNQAKNLTVDTQTYTTPNSSLTFDAYTGTNTITSDPIVLLSQPAINLGSQWRKGVIAMWVFMENQAVVTSVNLVIGSNSFNYITMSTNTQSDGTVFIQGWNLVLFSLATGVVTGSLTTSGIQAETGEVLLDESGYSIDPEGTTIDADASMFVNYSQINVVTTGNTLLNIDNIIYSAQNFLAVNYYSKYLFSDAVTNAWKEVFTADADFINLSIDTYYIFTALCQMYIARQQAGADSMFDFRSYEQEYKEGLMTYKKRYPSECLPTANSYYDTTINDRIYKS